MFIWAKVISAQKGRPGRSARCTRERGAVCPRPVTGPFHQQGRAFGATAANHHRCCCALIVGLAGREWARWVRQRRIATQRQRCDTRGMAAIVASHNLEVSMSLPRVDALPDVAADPRLAWTLSARAYTDRQIFESERQRVFASTWQPVASLDRLQQPGQQLACQVAGWPLVVLRDEQGRLRAFHDVCRHRAGPLTDGPGRVCQRKTLQCRYHGWTYSLDGRLLHTPGLREPAVEPGSGPVAPILVRDDFSLQPVDVASFGPLVFVRLRQPAPSLPGALGLLEGLGELPAEVAAYADLATVLYEKREYIVECNWKVYVDNYLEGYHIPMVHPALMRELDYPLYRVEPRAYHSRQYAPIRALPTGTNPAAAHAVGREYLPSEGQGAAAYYWVFPNLMLNYYPDHLQVNVVLPISVDRTAVLFEWYFADDGSAEQQQKQRRRIEFADQVQREDATICQAVQQRLATGLYDRGRFVPEQEAGVHHFQRLVLRSLQGASDDGRSE